MILIKISPVVFVLKTATSLVRVNNTQCLVHPNLAALHTIVWLDHNNAISFIMIVNANVRVQLQYNDTVDLQELK